MKGVFDRVVEFGINSRAKLKWTGNFSAAFRRGLRAAPASLLSPREPGQEFPAIGRRINEPAAAPGELPR